MTLDELIKRLEWMRGQVGGGCDVKVVGVAGVPLIRVDAETVESRVSETGVDSVVWLSFKPAE